MQYYVVQGGPPFHGFAFHDPLNFVPEKITPGWPNPLRLERAIFEILGFVDNLFEDIA